MTSIRHDKVIAVEVDLDRSLIIVTKNNAKNPLVLTTPEPMKVGAIVATATGTE
jgi:hypothetical protein